MKENQLISLVELLAKKRDELAWAANEPMAHFQMNF